MTKRIKRHNGTGATSGAETVYPSEIPEFTIGLQGVRVAQSLVSGVCALTTIVSLYSFALKRNRVNYIRVDMY
jgi:hypothetical protein